MSTLFKPDDLVVPFELLRMTDVETVGGKNASLGEMISHLPTGVKVPTGFATTAHAFREFLKFDGLDAKINARLLALDTGHTTGSVAGEVLARVASECWKHLKSAPQRLAMPDFPEGTSPALTEHYHPRAEDIAMAVAKILGASMDRTAIASQRDYPHDVPGNWFNGPF